MKLRMWPVLDCCLLSLIQTKDTMLMSLALILCHLNNMIHFTFLSTFARINLY